MYLQLVSKVSPAICDDERPHLFGLRAHTHLFEPVGKGCSLWLRAFRRWGLADGPRLCTCVVPISQDDNCSLTPLCLKFPVGTLISILLLATMVFFGLVSPRISSHLHYIFSFFLSLFPRGRIPSRLHNHHGTPLGARSHDGEITT